MRLWRTHSCVPCWHFANTFFPQTPSVEMSLDAAGRSAHATFSPYSSLGAIGCDRATPCLRPEIERDGQVEPGEEQGHDHGRDDDDRSAGGTRLLRYDSGIDDPQPFTACAGGLPDFIEPAIRRLRHRPSRLPARSDRIPPDPPLRRHLFLRDQFTAYVRRLL